MNVLFRMLFIALVAMGLTGCLATGGGVYRDKHVTLGGVASNARPMPRPYYGGGPMYGAPPPVVYQQMPHYASPVVVVPQYRQPRHHHHHDYPPMMVVPPQTVPWMCDGRNARRNDYHPICRQGVQVVPVPSPYYNPYGGVHIR